MIIDDFTIEKETIERAAKGNTYAKFNIKNHLRKWLEAYGKDHAQIEAQHIIIHSIAFLKKEDIDKYSDELMKFINEFKD